MNTSGDARLQRLLGGVRLASLRKRLRRRFERAPLDGPIKSIRIDELTADEYEALASLLGRPQRYSNSLQIDIDDVDERFLRSGIATSLRDALERLDGPIMHHAAVRLRDQSQWSDVIAGCDHQGLVRLLQTPVGLGLLKRLSRQDATTALGLCRDAAAVMVHLPAKGITRSRLAADVLGDAHALDGGRAAATIILAALRHAAGGATGESGDPSIDPMEDSGAERNAVAERDRDVWARSGVLVNELARPALFLNLPTRGVDHHGWRPGEPAYASLRALLRSPPSWDVANRRVHVCENPNLLAIAADHWGADCAPMVCTDGMPAVAQRCLLSQLTEAGALLLYHGDFDWPGLSIANHVMRAHGAQPWRFGTLDYTKAVGTVSGAKRPLRGNAIDAAWDQMLTPAMREHGISIAEEAVVDSLLQDLRDR